MWFIRWSFNDIYLYIKWFCCYFIKRLIRNTFSIRLYASFIFLNAWGILIIFFYLKWNYTIFRIFCIFTKCTFLSNLSCCFFLILFKNIYRPLSCSLTFNFHQRRALIDFTSRYCWLKKTCESFLLQWKGSDKGQRSRFKISPSLYFIY